MVLAMFVDGVGKVATQMDIWIGIATLAMSIVGSAVGLGFKIGKVEQRLTSFEHLLTMGTSRMDRHETEIDSLDHRLTIMETQLK